MRCSPVNLEQDGPPLADTAHNFATVTIGDGAYRRVGSICLKCPVMVIDIAAKLPPCEDRAHGFFG